MARRIILLLSVPALIAIVTPVHAQRLHEGFWISWAPGGIAVAGDEGLGYPLYVRAGGTLKQRVLIGVEYQAVMVDYYSGGLTSNLTGTALLYPSDSGGFFVKPGIGLSRGAVSCSTPSAPTPPGGASTEQGTDGTSLGLGTTLGVGYDVRLGRNFYITPNLDILLQTHPRPCLDPGTRTGPLLDTSPAIALTLGLTWH